jgi:cellulose biosynthesis protein BcsQ
VYVIQIKSKKGGVGKSLYARELAQALAALGCHIALIDASEQANNDILENQQRTFDYTLKECLIAEHSFQKAIRQVRKNLWLLAGSRNHEEINNYIRTEHDQNLFKYYVDEFRATLQPETPYEQRFLWWQQEKVGMNIFHLEATTDEEFFTPPTSIDFMLIDSDASTEDELTLNIWNAIDGILVPFEPTELDWHSYHQLKEDLAKRYRRHIEQMPSIIGVLPNKVLHTKDNPTPLIYLKSIYQNADEVVFRPVHWSKIFGECLNLHIGSLEHPSASTDRAVRELCAITLDLIGYEGELLGIRSCEKCSAAHDEARQEQEGQPA